MDIFAYVLYMQDLMILDLDNEQVWCSDFCDKSEEMTEGKAVKWLKVTAIELEDA